MALPFTSAVAFAAEPMSGKIYLSDSRGEKILTNDWAQIGEFLLEDYDLTDRKPPVRVVKTVWHLDEFVKAISRTWDKDFLSTWGGGGFKDIIPPYRIFYEPGRLFGITAKYKEHIKENLWQENIVEANLYNLRQFYPGQPQPQTIADIEQAAKDVLLAFRRMGLQPTKLTSAVAVYQDILAHMSVPRACDVPEESLEALTYAANDIKEWREVFQIGHWSGADGDMAADYDITSGYPSEAMNLLDFRKAKIWKSDTVPSDFDWAIMNGKVTIHPDTKVSPILYWDGTHYVSRTGTWADFLTNEQADWLKKWQRGTFDMKDGWFLKYPRVCAKPFEAIMQRLFNLRGDSPLRDTIAKSIANGVIGLWQQEFSDAYGPYFSPILACQAISRVGLKDANFVYENRMIDDLISITVDGVLASKLVPCRRDRVMGQWRLNKPGPALVASTGYQWLADKKPGNVTYEQMMEAIKGKPNASSYLGVLDLNLLDLDRHFPKMPRTGRQLLDNKYQSEPIEVEET